ncbi:VanZ family protein [Granulosicoccus sp. 3-233]|uniref:VanZ family protein n=1 Tax=Granulosicoccus sp. 3-233 TaxID=3417969 RepID=UPI003D34B4FD
MSFDFTPRAMLSVRHLRYRRLWIAVGVALILMVAIASMITIPAPLKVVMMKDKLMHTLAYAGLMGWFAQIYRHDLTRLLLAVGLVLMGVGIEYLQGMTTTRHFDVLDMVANTSGVVLAWALAYTWVGTLLARFEGLFSRSTVHSSS